MRLSWRRIGITHKFLLCSNPECKLHPLMFIGEAAMPTHLVLRRGTRLVSFAAALVALGFAAGDTLAQQAPYRQRSESYNRDYGREGGREHQPGVFDYYLLAL